MGTIRVKPLEWFELTSPREDGPPEYTGDWNATSVLGDVCVEYYGEDGYSVWLDADMLGYFDNADEAKEAAQDAYSAIILSAIEAS